MTSFELSRAEDKPLRLERNPPNGPLQRLPTLSPPFLLPLDAFFLVRQLGTFPQPR